MSASDGTRGSRRVAFREGGRGGTDGWTGEWAESWLRGRRLQALGLNLSLPLRSATAATAPPAAPAGEGGPPGPPPNLTSNRRLQQTQAQVDEVSCVWVGAAKDSRKDTEGWQTSAGVHRGLEVIAVHAYEFWDKDILCPIPVSVHLKGS